MTIWFLSLTIEMEEHKITFSIGNLDDDRVIKGWPEFMNMMWRYWKFEAVSLSNNHLIYWTAFEEPFDQLGYL
jgi:hypothetical protein